jgi:hypothetical protein
MDSSDRDQLRHQTIYKRNYNERYREKEGIKVNRPRLENRCGVVVEDSSLSGKQKELGPSGDGGSERIKVLNLMWDGN